MQQQKLVLMPSKIEKNNKICSNIFVFLCLFFAFVSALVANVYGVVTIKGESMVPTANANAYDVVGEDKEDRAIINFYASYKVGDIIIARPNSSSDPVIKRVIALEGDTLTYKVVDGDIKLVRNGQVLEETYINPTSTMIASRNNFLALKNKKEYKEYFDGDVLTIPKGYIFYMGDNRDNSSDCNYYGPQKLEIVIARVDFIVPYGENPFFYAIKTIFNRIIH